jgi:signal transduction histidine kinase
MHDGGPKANNDVLCRQAALLALDRTLICHCGPDPAVIGDPDALKEVHLILLDNALKSTPPGSTVTVTAAVHGPDVATGIQDSGSGIAPDLTPPAGRDGVPALGPGCCDPLRRL